jgi:hypothetical protein
VFSLYLYCLYFGTNDLELRIEMNITEAWNTEKDGDITLKRNAKLKQVVTIDLYIYLYTLADKLLDPTTANLVINQLMGFSGKHRASITLDSITITRIYDSSTGGSPLRKLVCDLHLSNAWAMRLPQGDCKNLPVEFLRDLINETSRLHRGNPQQRIDEVFRDRTMSRRNGSYLLKVDQKSQGA